MSPPKYVNLVVLAAGLVVFAISGFPLLGYAAGAAAWLTGRGVQILAVRGVSWSCSRSPSPPRGCAALAEQLAEAEERRGAQGRAQKERDRAEAFLAIAAE